MFKVEVEDRTQMLHETSNKTIDHRIIDKEVTIDRHKHSNKDCSRLSYRYREEATTTAVPITVEVIGIRIMDRIRLQILNLKR